MNLLIDASNVIHRSFYMSQKQYQDSSNMQVLLFLRSLKSYADMFKPTAIYCAWDALLDHSVKSYRKQIASETYKTNRDKDKGASVYEKSTEIRDIVEHLGIYNIYPFCLEADDVIAFLTRQLTGKKVIVSSDKDLLQLVDQDTSMYSLSKKTLITQDNFEQFAGINKDAFLIHKCLIGDASDNIAKVTTPSKAKKIALGADMQSILDSNQIELFKHNFKMMNLHESYDHQPQEHQRMVQQLAELQQQQSKRDFNAFIDMCNELQLSSIVNNSANWRKTFFQQQNMSNLIKLLGIHK